MCLMRVRLRCMNGIVSTVNNFEFFKKVLVLVRKKCYVFDSIFIIFFKGLFYAQKVISQNYGSIWPFFV